MLHPIKSARGRFRPGSCTSPPVKVTLFQADCANNGPDIARPRNINSARVTVIFPAAANPSCEACGCQPFTDGFHQDEVNAALPCCRPTFQPIVSPTITNPSSAAVFVKVKVF